jgi:hypothetical protein
MSEMASCEVIGNEMLKDNCGRCRELSGRFMSRARMEELLSPILARRATEQCIIDSYKIDQTLPICFRSNAAKPLTPERRQNLIDILAERKKIRQAQ